MDERETIQRIYIRLCRDSRYTIKAENAAILAGNVLGISPLVVWTKFPSFAVMEEIASGTHPVCSPLAH